MQNKAPFKNLILFLQKGILARIEKSILITVRDLAVIALFSFVVSVFLLTPISLYLINQKPSSFFFAKESSHFNYTVQHDSLNSSFEKNILSRNIFNISGIIPQEKEEKIGKNFSEIPCTYSEKMPVELLGIIYTGHPETSLVSLKDTAAPFADIYKEGQPIIDNEGYEVYRISSPVHVEFKHGEKKLCYSLKDAANTKSTEILASSDRVASNEQSYDLDAAYVNSQIGAGFSKILNSVKLVPYLLDGKMQGLKVVSVVNDSLFKKIGLESGDVITSVNGTSLEDASQGFKVFETFRDNVDITIEINRSGNKITKRVSVR